MEKHPGIVFAGGEGPHKETLKRLLGGRSLRDFAAGQLTVAADSGLLLAKSLDFEPDWVVGDMDSLGDESCLLSYPAEKVVRYPADKDFTDLELALSLLWEKGCTEAMIIGGGGGRIAHVFAIRDMFERERFAQRWITLGEDIRCIDSASFSQDALKAACAIGDKVSVFPLADGPWEAQSCGLKWPLNGLQWKRGSYGMSNVALESEICIRAAKGRFMVILETTCQLR